MAERAPSEAAVVGLLPDGNETILRRAELERMSSARAATFTKVAKSAGGMAVICISAHRTPHTIVDIMAAIRAGLPVLPLDPSLPAEARERMLRYVRNTYASTIEARSSQLRLTEAKRKATEIAGYFLATGGTSGGMKIVARPGPVTYDPRLVPSRALSRARWRAGQRQLIVGPLHHAAPFTCCLAGVLDEGTIVLPDKFDPAFIWRIIDSYRVEWFQLTPTHMARMISSISGDSARLSRIQGILHTAAFCPCQVKRRWLELVDPSRIFELYAATEDIGATLASGEEWIQRPGTVGRGVLTQIRILDEKLNPLPAGSEGRIFMRAPGSRRGVARYLGRIPSEQTPDGFQSVGDYGWLDDDGYLFLAPRREDMITVAGKNVYPADIENVIAEHPLVSDVAVVGVPDTIFGSKIVAVVSTHGDQPLTLADLLSHCQSLLALHQLPRSVHQVTRVPRNDAGKIQRRLLPSLFGEAELWPHVLSISNACAQ